jgi:competence ComEA-like helix-hairpin-helix protein
VGQGREATEEEPTASPAGSPDSKPEPDRVEAVASGDRININDATFEDLRELGFSVTQATRVITYRERQNGFESIDDLIEVPGMPDEFLTEIRNRLTLKER